MHFRTKEFVDIVDILPQLRQINSTGLSQGADIFLAANGFEDRSLAVPEMLANTSRHFKAACYFEYDRNFEDNAKNRDKLLCHLSRITDDHSAIDSALPDGAFDQVMEGILAETSSKGTVSVLFDVSGATSRLIMRVIRVLFGLADRADVDIELTLAYAQAESYFPTKEEALGMIRNSTQDQGFNPITLGLDYEADELTYLVEHPGQHIETLPEHAVVLCGFNADRVRASLDKIDTAFNIDAPHPRVSYVVGEPPGEDDKWRRQAMLDINSAGLTNGAIDPSVTSTLHYLETLLLLEKIYESIFGIERITVIPFGSKMQTVAVSIFCELHPDVRVQILAPARYNGTHYSRGVRTLYELPFGSLAYLSAELRSIGALLED